MPTFAVKFLGCKVSQADAMLARSRLIEAGHTEVPEAQAGLHVINTCCITSEAEAKSRQAVRRSLRTGREVFVAGCAVNLHAPAFDQIGETVRPFVGVAEDVGAEMAAALGLGACADLDSDVLRRAPARSRAPGLSRAPAPSRAPDPATPTTRTRGFVKVQDGCDSHCAYCIIPTVRGRARSRPASGVLAEVRRRLAQGQPEIVVTGISVGDYLDPEQGLELGDLLIAIARIEGVHRVRLSSVEVIHVKDSLVRALATEPKVCPHLHVPMQSGDDEVLSAMRRHYTAAEYLNRITELRSKVPDVNVTTDAIVGFPTEHESAFDRTLALIDAAGITRVHVFPFSPRPGTAAESLGDAVSSDEKKRRSQALRGASEARSRIHRSEKLGRCERVLIDKVADSQCSGYTPDYTRCYLPASAGGRGTLVDVVCDALQADGLECRVSAHAPAILDL